MHRAAWPPIAFWLLALERLVLVLSWEDERKPYLYVVRVLAYVTIIAGILDKNRKRRKT